ncbi:hypothetical protein TELCIR_17208, partial [Teladorsagia circumcincta]
MVSTVYDLLRIYVDEGYLTIQPWLRITLLTIDEMEFNPNINVEFRNQAAAQTDCLLQYKVADGTHSKFSSAPAYRPNTPNQISEKPLLTKRDIDELQLDFERMSSKPEVARIFPTLPRRFIYREVIDQCFEDTYYKYHYSGNVKELKCPGPDRCL